MTRQVLRVFCVLTLFLGLGMAAPETASGQEGEPAQDPAATPDSIPEPADLVATDSAVVDSADSAEQGERPSPMGSLLRSVVLPGWGQYTTGHPVRGTIYLLAEGAALVMVFDKQSQLRAARIATPPDSMLIASRTRAREDWIVAAAFIALVSGVDAWASAHFWGFEGEIVGPPGGELGMAYQVSIPFGGP
ncbi:MAG: hypothetical protein ABFS14_03415 [Gemmatimonadota bacterium]